MNDFEDEIIDLDAEIPDRVENDEKIEKEIELPPVFNQPRINKQTNNSFPNKNNTFRNNINDDSTSRKLQSLGNKNRSIPFLNNGTNTKTEENNVETQENTNTITKGIVAGQKAKQATEITALFSKTGTLKFKIIAACVVVIISFLLILIIAVAGQSETETLGENTHTYVTGSMTEDELIDQLQYYDYCDSADECKQKGIYGFYERLKDIYEQYSKTCPSKPLPNQPCEITINTALIIETINYYHNSEEPFYSYNEGNSESIFQQEGFSISNFFSSLVQKYRKQKAIEDMVNDVEKLALAQAEYVEETCQYINLAEKNDDLKDKKVNNKKDKYKNYYYEVSFDKYISYLKYGETSSHPNYQGQPVKKVNEICEHSSDDYISTDYTSNGLTSSETGLGYEIAKYALGFVGGKYVYGGTNLETGVDCSGFTMKVMEAFGITIPRTTTQQINVGTNIGTDINSALPGDLIFYEGHVAIYGGQNNIIHAANSKPYPLGGIKIDKANYRPIIRIVRVWANHNQ